MKNLAFLLLALNGLVAGCIPNDGDEDGRDDSFTTDGKADTGSIVDGSAEALAVLDIANTRSEEEMHDHGVPKLAAQNIVAVRLGDDGLENTSDDVTLATLAQLDAVPYVGPVAFARLLSYANELTNAATSTPVLTPPANMWTVAACSPMTFSQLISKFPAGSTQISFVHSFSTASRHRDACNPVTGCTAWMNGGVSLIYHYDDTYSSMWKVPFPTTSNGGVEAILYPSEPSISFQAYDDGAQGGSDELTYSYECYAVTQDPSPSLDCEVSLRRHSDPYKRVSFRDERWAATVSLQGRMCSDGRFHFTTEVPGDNSSDPQNLQQIALYGRLF